MLRLARRWPERTWAVEGAAGVGVQLAQRLVADGETVLDVPPKLSTRARIFDVGHGRKNDPGDARTWRWSRSGPGSAPGGARRRDGRPAADERAPPRPGPVPDPDGEQAAPVADGAHRRRSRAESDRQEGQGAARDRPARDVAGRNRRQLAADLIEDLVGLDRKITGLDGQLKAAVAATGTTLTDINGVGTGTAAMILGEVGDVRRFPARHHFATYGGVAPIEVSSGEVGRHRLSRAGNRRSTTPCTSSPCPTSATTPAAATTTRRVAAGKGKKGALRCLKRRLSDSVYRRLVDDQQRRAQGSPGGHLGATYNPARPAHTPTPTLRSSHTPGSTKTLRPVSQSRLDTEGSR